MNDNEIEIIKDGFKNEEKFELLTFRQADVIRKSLPYSMRRKAINEYCGNLKKSWLELSKDEAIILIEQLVKMSWQ